MNSPPRVAGHLHWRLMGVLCGGALVVAIAAARRSIPAAPPAVDSRIEQPAPLLVASGPWPDRSAVPLRPVPQAARPTVAAPAAGRPAELVADIDPTGHASIAEAVSAARHAVEAIDPAASASRGARFFTANPKQRMRAWFGARAVQLSGSCAAALEVADPVPDPQAFRRPAASEDWNLTVQLRGHGRDGAISPPGPRTTTASGSRVEYSDPASRLTEWFENQPAGIEHGFTLTERPAGRGALEVRVAVAGDLRPVPPTARDAVTLVDRAGNERLEYTGLHAFDAGGRPLPARIDVIGSELALVVDDVGARYPVTIDPLFAHIEAQATEESFKNSWFGLTLAVSGDTAIAGMPSYSTPAHWEVGGAMVFVRVGDEWIEQARLIVGNGAAYDRAGSAVAIDGDTALVTCAAKVHVFIREGLEWHEQFVIEPGDAMGGAHFGQALAVAGDTAVVAAPYRQQLAEAYAGAAYVFTRTGAVWQQQTLLVPNDGGPAHFPHAVALDGDTALLGGGGWGEPGKAYVFTRAGGSWSEESTLAPAAPATDDFFGRAVALAGDTALVGAPYCDAAGMNAGSAHVFVRDTVGWSLQQTLTANDAKNSDFFGGSVALVGDAALIGSRNYDVFEITSGKAYLFERAAGVWSESSVIAPGAWAANEMFGISVALAGDSALVGSVLSDSIAGADAGAVSVFTRSGADWVQHGDLAATNGPAGDLCGAAVAMDGVTAVVGAATDQTPGGQGSVLVFVHDGSYWIQQAKLRAVDGGASDRFGSAVALSGDTLVVGAPFHVPPGSTGNPGAAYVFVRNQQRWQQQAKLLPTADDLAFGSTVAVDGDTAWVGAPDSNSQLGALVGSACVFLRDATNWSFGQRITPPADQSGGRFGAALALAGDTCVAGSPGLGRVNVFSRAGVSWSLETVLQAADDQALSGFGTSVALDGDTLLVGAPAADAADIADAGAAYVFTRAGMAWSEEAKLTAAAGATGDRFGIAVAVSGLEAVIGANGRNLPGATDAGNACYFTRGQAGWTEGVTMTAGAAASRNDLFGSAVAMAGGRILVAAPGDQSAGPGAGAAYLFVLGESVTITEHPQSATIPLTGPAEPITMHVTATGQAPLYYQWRKDGYNIAGASGEIPGPGSGVITGSASYLIAAPVAGDAGVYDVVVSNLGSSATSRQALVLHNTFPTAHDPGQGSLIVALTPPDIGAAWRFVGEPAWRPPDQPVTSLAPGSRELEFRPVAGFHQPLRESITIASDPQPALLVREYHPLDGPVTMGSLTVTIAPASLAAPEVPKAERAQWRLLGEGEMDWRDSGEFIDSLQPGVYLVECKPVAGRTTPPPTALRVRAATTVTHAVLYRAADAPLGSQPQVLDHVTVTTSEALPYAYVGQLHSDLGSATGFVVRPQVVATAANVVFDEATLSYVRGLSWHFQRDRLQHEPAPVLPRGFHVFEEYAALRDPAQTAGVVAGEASPQSQDRDVAALFFLGDAGHGGFSGLIASDSVPNEWLTSNALKMIVGYPVENTPADLLGRMHATLPAPDVFSPAYQSTYTTTGITSRGGTAGGPLCVQINGQYFPAAIYLGGSPLTTVRAIDSDVLWLFGEAEAAANGSTTPFSPRIDNSPGHESADTGCLMVSLNLPAGGWRIEESDPAGLFRSAAGPFTIDATPVTIAFKEVAGFIAPPPVVTTINAGLINAVVANYTQTYDSWSDLDLGELPPELAAADADADADGASNLLEFAFHMVPTTPDFHYLKPGTGTTGLPAFSLVGSGDTLRLRFEFVRRTATSAPVITYTPQFADSPAGPWVDATSQPTVTPIDEIWERVVVEDEETAATTRYGRVQVAIIPAP